jgi:hypothetical protein
LRGITSIPNRSAEYWVDRVERLSRPASGYSWLPMNERRRRLPEFMADDMATVETIYRTAGTPLTDEARTQLETYGRENSRASTGK